LEPPQSIAGFHAYGISPNRIISISVTHYFSSRWLYSSYICIETTLTSADLGYDVSDEMIMMNKMMSFLSGRVVHDEVDSDYNIIRARQLCGSWADGQRKIVVISQIPVGAASTYNHNALYF
jgi:hypothetical protein